MFSVQIIMLVFRLRAEVEESELEVESRPAKEKNNFLMQMVVTLMRHFNGRKCFRGPMRSGWSTSVTIGSTKMMHRQMHKMRSKCAGCIHEQSIIECA